MATPVSTASEGSGSGGLCGLLWNGQGGIEASRQRRLGLGFVWVEVLSGIGCCENQYVFSSPMTCVSVCVILL
jgi:hypothetical protein